MNEDKVFPIFYDFQRLNIPSHHTYGNSIGMFNNEIQCLIWCALNSSSGDWIEIGSHKGGSTIVLCLVRQYLKYGPTIYTFDKKYDEWFDKNINNNGFFHLIKKIEDTTPNFEAYYTKNQYLSLAFIDGFHSFKWILQDFHAIQPYLTSDCIICFHDCSPHMYSSRNIEYVDHLYSQSVTNYDKWINDESHNFLVDEAISYIMRKYGYQLLEIPVRNNEVHVKETGLTKWKRGTTSTFNSFVGISKKIR
jgi:predicted O-methyltransferase YrrM